jgi:ATP:corrinoid adenosyltransferase
VKSEFQKYLDEMLPQVKFNDNPSEFKITIEEHISQSFRIEAIDIEEAMEIAQEKYRKGEIVLEGAEVNAKLMMAEDELTGECTEWEEF